MSRLTSGAGGALKLDRHDKNFKLPVFKREMCDDPADLVLRVSLGKRTLAMGKDLSV
jgi:hypothetical protein